MTRGAPGPRVAMEPCPTPFRVQTIPLIGIATQLFLKTSAHGTGQRVKMPFLCVMTMIFRWRLILNTVITPMTLLTVNHNIQYILLHNSRKALCFYTHTTDYPCNNSAVRDNCPVTCGYCSTSAPTSSPTINYCIDHPYNGLDGAANCTAANCCEF